MFLLSTYVIDFSVAVGMKNENVEEAKISKWKQAILKNVINYKKGSYSYYSKLPHANNKYYLIKSLHLRIL